MEIEDQKKKWNKRNLRLKCGTSGDKVKSCFQEWIQTENQILLVILYGDRLFYFRKEAQSNRIILKGPICKYLYRITRMIHQFFFRSFENLEILAIIKTKINDDANRVVVNMQKQFPQICKKSFIGFEKGERDTAFRIYLDQWMQGRLLLEKFFLNKSFQQVRPFIWEVMRNNEKQKKIIQAVVVLRKMYKLKFRKEKIWEIVRLGWI